MADADLFGGAPPPDNHAYSLADIEAGEALFDAAGPHARAVAVRWAGALTDSGDAPWDRTASARDAFEDGFEEGRISAFEESRQERDSLEREVGKATSEKGRIMYRIQRVVELVSVGKKSANDEALAILRAQVEQMQADGVEPVDKPTVAEWIAATGG